jgi:phenylalanine ammonia-lyase
LIDSVLLSHPLEGDVCMTVEHLVAEGAEPPDGSDPVVELTGDRLTALDVRSVALRRARVAMPPNDGAVRAGVDRSVRAVEQMLERELTVYGLTTGFGGRANVLMGVEHAAALQSNLVHYHRAGTGGRLPETDVRAAMLIRANSNLRGVSGLRWEVIERLVQLLNLGVTPIVRSHGSIGASGDLTPLASITACAVGLDDHSLVSWRGRDLPATEALSELGLAPIALRAKEALALMNGTAVSAGMAVNCVVEARTILGATLGFHALAVQALGGSAEPFAAFVHAQKPHAGQGAVASAMRSLLSGSQLALRHDPAAPRRDGRLVQDRYSLRCLAQFLGPIVEQIDSAIRQLEIEMNSASDNPLIDVDEGVAYHCGNFLAEHVATALDGLRHHVGLAAKHVDVQLALLMAPEFSDGLPAALVGNEQRPINMGLKAVQITANALMPQIVFHGMPIAHLFATHAEQFNQNVNSLSMPAALLAHTQAELARQHAAIALLCAVQAVDLRTRAVTGQCDARETLSPATAPLYMAVRRTLDRPPDRARPLVYDDHEQVLEVFIDALVGALAEPSSELATVVDALAPTAAGAGASQRTLDD